MKYIRLFPSASIRDAVLAEIEHSVLSYTEGSGIKVKPEGSSPAYSTPFYVENITNEVETLIIAGYDWARSGIYLEIPIEYSTDGTVWSSFGTTGETPLTRTLQPGEKVYLRATTNAWYQGSWGDAIEHSCSIFGVSKVGGNIMSLLYGSNFTGIETIFPNGSTMNFSGLFNNINDEDGYNRNLTSASELILPATTLSPNCYNSMFNGCTSLTTAPELPATTLADYCYSGMFYGCTSLTMAPELPATTLASGCYLYMFQGCTNLNYIKCLATDISARGCLDDWVSGVSSTGTFIKNPSMANWPSGTSGIPSGWTVQDAASDEPVQ